LTWIQSKTFKNIQKHATEKRKACRNGMEWNGMDACQHNQIHVWAKHEEVKKVNASSCFQDANLHFVDVVLEDLHSCSPLWEHGAWRSESLAAEAPAMSPCLDKIGSWFTWVCLKMGSPNGYLNLNRENNDIPVDLEVHYFQTNPHMWTT
jgi:hypothetical protein